MRMLKLILAAALFTGATAMTAADDKLLDVTIRIVESPADLPSAVTKTIELPPAAAERARERSQPGLERANEARKLGRETGQSIAEEAKTRGLGQGQNPGFGRGQNPGRGQGRGRP